MDSHLRRAGLLISVAVAAYIVLPSFRVSTYKKRNTTGLVNPGNDCYANSIIQALSALGNLEQWLADQNKSPFVVSLQNTLNELRLEFSGVDRSISVRPLLKAIESQLNARFTYGQHDAHEFLVHILDVLEKDKDVLSPFAGTIVDQIRCLNCEFQFERSQACKVLEVQPNDSILEFKPEMIEGYRCGHCNMLTTIEKTSCFNDFPAILAVHLNRSIVQSGQIFRSRESSEIPLHIGPYTLQSVIFHHGNNHASGHYTCARRKVVLGATSKHWWQISDTYVEEASNEQITSRQKDAYILFYEKTDWTRAMSSIQKHNIYDRR